jgi:membrane fusion protein (multidrug efflux system)
MKKKIMVRVIIGLFLLGLIIAGINLYIYSVHHEQTDNAQLEGDISPIIPKVSGYVTRVNIEDNQLVKKGDTLFEIDDRDLRNRVLLAQAAYNHALAGIEVMRSDLSSAHASTEVENAHQLVTNAALKTAEARLWKAQQDFQRYKNLLEDEAATQQQFDAVKTEKEVAESELAVLKKQVFTATQQTSASQSEARTKSRQIAVAQALVDQRKADLEFAQLQLSYTVVTAPAAGYVSKKNIQVGEYVNAGQTLFSLIESSDLWVVANFKETQLERIRVGSEVEIRVDAFEDQPLKGTVLSFAKATGARFSLLPPDNATGNFVKVVQRIPVKIKITSGGETVKRLAPGMSVKVAVSI